MCNYTRTTGPAGAARAPRAPPPTGAPTRAACGAHVDRGGTSWPERAIYKAAPAARPLRLYLSPVSAALNISLLSIDRRTPRVSGLAHAPRIKKDVPAREQRWPVPNRCTTGGEHNSG